MSSDTEADKQLQSASLKVDADGKIVDAGSYNLEYCQVYPNQPPDEWESFNLIPSITKISITESLTMHSILVEIVLRDGGDILEKLKISGNELIEIKISQDTISEDLKEMKLKLRISDVIHYSRPTAGSSSFVIQAIPEIAYYSRFQIKDGAFDGSIGELINNLREDVNIENEAAPKDSSIIKGVYPSLHPLEAISWLNKRAYGPDSTPYYFWNTCIGSEGEDTLNWNWRSLGDLMEDPVYRTYNNKPVQEFTREDGEKYYNDTLERIQKITSDLNLSVYNQMKHGGYASEFICIDLSKKTIDIEFETYPDVENGKGWKRLNEFPTYSTECTKNVLPWFDTGIGARASRHHLTKNDLAFDGSSYQSYHSQAPDNILKQQMYVTNFEHMTQNLELGGDLNLSAGKVIELDMKSYDGKEATPNNLIGGKYIVTEITHVFLPNNYMMEVKAQKDSAAIDYNEQIQIPKEESTEEDTE